MAIRLTEVIEHVDICPIQSGGLFQFARCFPKSRTCVMRVAQIRVNQDVWRLQSLGALQVTQSRRIIVLSERDHSEEKIGPAQFRLNLDRLTVGSFGAVCLSLLVVKIAQIRISLSHLWAQADYRLIFVGSSLEIPRRLCLLSFGVDAGQIILGQSARNNRQHSNSESDSTQE